jgi:hypothetical protein
MQCGEFVVFTQNFEDPVFLFDPDAAWNRHCELALRSFYAQGIRDINRYAFW